jgi:hypothetical protein
MDPATVARLSHALPLFERAADSLVLQLRKALDVPAQAEDDVEQEFAAVRRQLDDYRPEFEALFSGLLVQHLGAEHLPAVLAALEQAAAQHYLRQAPALEVALRAELERLHQAMTALAQQLIGS